MCRSLKKQFLFPEIDYLGIRQKCNDGWNKACIRCITFTQPHIITYMKFQKLLSLLCVTYLGLASGLFASEGWMTDFEAAQAKAKAENKPMLLDFTGSDWCGWCIKLDEEVFSQTAFSQYAAAELVLVEIDFPRRTDQPAKLKAQNEALAQKYGIRGFPTILVLSPEGELIEKTGYRRGGPRAYVAHIKEILAK